MRIDPLRFVNELIARSESFRELNGIVMDVTHSVYLAATHT